MCRCCRATCWWAFCCGCFGLCMQSCSPRHTKRSVSYRGTDAPFTPFTMLLDLDDDADAADADVAGDAAVDTGTASLRLPGDEPDGWELDDIAPATLSQQPVAGTGAGGGGGGGGSDELDNVPSQPPPNRYIPMLSDAQKLELVQMHAANPQHGVCIYCFEPPRADLCTDNPNPCLLRTHSWASASDEMFGSLCDCDPFQQPRHLKCWRREVESVTPLSSRSCRLCSRHIRAFAYVDPTDDEDAAAATAASTVPAARTLAGIPIRLLVFPQNMSAAGAAAIGLTSQFSLVASPLVLDDADLARQWTSPWHGFRAGEFSVYCAPPDSRWPCSNPPPDVYNVVHVIVTLYNHPIRSSLVMSRQFPTLASIPKPSGRKWGVVRASKAETVSRLAWHTVLVLRAKLIGLSYPLE